MRAILRTTHPRLRLLFAALGVSAGFAACADALHLDPPGTGGSVARGDGGPCISNPDCAYPAPVCNTVTQTCVECLVFSDCAAKPGTVCSRGACQCPNPANSATPLTYCPSPTPGCFDTTTSKDNCGGCAMPCTGTCSGGICDGSDSGADSGDSGADSGDDGGDSGDLDGADNG